MTSLNANAVLDTAPDTAPDTAFASASSLHSLTGVYRRKHIIREHDRWIEVFLDDHSDITDADLLVFRADLHEVRDWQTKPLLIHMGSLIGVSLEGRRLIRRHLHPTPVAIIGRHPMDRVMASFILPPSPQTRYFPVLADAQQWLQIRDSQGRAQGK